MMNIKEMNEEIWDKVEEVEACVQNIMDIISDIKDVDNPNVKDLLESIEYIGGEAESAMDLLNG